MLPHCLRYTGKNPKINHPNPQSGALEKTMPQHQLLSAEQASESTPGGTSTRVLGHVLLPASNTHPSESLPGQLWWL